MPCWFGCNDRHTRRPRPGVRALCGAVIAHLAAQRSNSPYLERERGTYLAQLAGMNPAAPATTSHVANSPVPATFFDRPGRSTPIELAVQAALVHEAATVENLLSGLPGPTCLLNDHRQIVFANEAALALLGSMGPSGDAKGRRLGEALGCVFAKHGPDGCGTAPQCRHCGLGQVNRAFGIRPGTYARELHLRSGEGAAEQALTLSIHLSPLRVGGAVFRLCSLADLTASRRREALENIFFHDVLNTAQAVQGAAELIPFVDDAHEQEELARIVSENAKGLVGEIQAQRDLLCAEDGTLQVPHVPEHLFALADRIADLYRRSGFGEGKTIVVEKATADDRLVTSPVHLARCVSNLVKNALEASAAGDTVRIRVSSTDDAVAVDVHNTAVMPEAVQVQVFQRSFSTKARSGRGLGTYSVRLLVTRYLGGVVSFESKTGEGTTFRITLPRTMG